MTNARRPSLSNAAIELTFVVIASALGSAGAPLWALGAITAALLAYWFWSRRHTLDEMRKNRPGALLGSVVLTLVLVGAVMAGAFFGGRAFSSMFS